MGGIIRTVSLGAMVAMFAPSGAHAARVISLGSDGQEVLTTPNAVAYRAGQRALEHNDTEGAVRSFRLCLAPNRSGAKCYRGIAQAYVQQNMPVLAATNYRMYLKLLPNAADGPSIRRAIRACDAAVSAQAANPEPLP